ncbi:MAG TPA: cytochrome b/b6 domain-containing protein [Gammaproteobacteria bacterium]|nr:cytochrome b/b6 domain-containing protein [Gammaproteobacteria bacterium]
MNSEPQCDVGVYRVWDLPVRLFHWINFLAVISLFFLGFVMLYKKELGISSLEAKIALKEVHVIIGYVFAANLLFRFVWAFAGNRFARWSAFLPHRGLAAEGRRYLQSLRRGEPEAWLGHNPLGRMAVAFLYLLLTIVAVTGLVRAGTDIYYPPFGALVQDYIAAEGVEPASLKPYDETGVDAGRLERMKAFKGPFGDIHLYTAWVLLAMLVVHIGAVILSDSREGGAIISAMFTGRKYLRGKPVDAADR